MRLAHLNPLTARGDEDMTTKPQAMLFLAWWPTAAVAAGLDRHMMILQIRLRPGWQSGIG